jgi:hypothetical protein
MRIKVVKGNDPTGLCQYLLDPLKQVQKSENPILHSNMSGRNGEELAEEFRFARTLNRRVQTSMCHYCVSMPPGEQVEQNNITAISKGLLHKMGHDKCQYFIVQHHDREHRNGVQHWHIATIAIALDGQWVDDGFNRRRLRQVEQQLEQQFALRQTIVRAVRERQNLTTGEYRLKERTGGKLPKERLWETIQQAAQEKPTLTKFIGRLQQVGVSVRLRGIEQGKVTGISYGMDGVAFPGAKLGPAYSFNGIQEHMGIDYNPERDNPTLQEAMQYETERVDHTTAAVADGQSATELLDTVGQTIDRIRQRRLKLQQLPVQDEAQTSETITTDEDLIKNAPLEQQTQRSKVKSESSPEIDWEL